VLHGITKQTVRIGHNSALMTMNVELELTKVQLILKLRDGHRNIPTLIISTRSTQIKMSKLKSNGMVILLKLLLLNLDNLPKLFTLSTQLASIAVVLPIMVCSSISTLDLNIPLMELDRMLKCTLFI